MSWLPAMRFTGRLPLPLLYAVAPVLHVMVFHLARYRRAVVIDNLSRVYAGRPEAERAAMMRRFYRRLADLAVEILAARTLPAEAFAERVRVTNPDLLRDLSAAFSTPVLLLTVHQGNWEWMLHGVGRALGHPLTPVYKTLHNASANAFMHEARARFGAEPVALEALSREILRRRREPRLWVMLADQAPVPGERSQPVDFLGQSTRFHAFPVALARRLAMPVVFAQCRRRRRGYYEVRFETLARDAASVSEAALVQRYASAAERAIREEPESWLWSNRRWKRDVSAGR